MYDCRYIYLPKRIRLVAIRNSVKIEISHMQTAIQYVDLDTPPIICTCKNATFKNIIYNCWFMSILFNLAIERLLNQIC